MRVNAFFEPKRTDIPDKECAWCGTMFTPHNARQVYCCMACKFEKIGADQHVRRREAAARMHAVAPVRVCAICGAPFQDVNQNRKTCSAACATTLERTRKRLYRRGHLGPILGTCVVCGQPFEKTNCAVTCSLECSRQRDREVDRARRAARKRGDIHIPQIIGPSWNLNYDPYAEGMEFPGFDGVAIPATSPQALPVY